MAERMSSKRLSRRQSSKLVLWAYELCRKQQRRRCVELSFLLHDHAERQPYLLADHHRAALLEGKVDEDEEDNAAEPLTNVQEQRILREGAINAFKSLAGDGEDSASEDEEAGFLLKPRSKEEEEVEQEDEEYRKFLLDMGGGEEEVRKILGMGEQPAWKAEEEAAPVSEGKKEKKKRKKDAALSQVEKEEIDKEKREKKEKKDDDFLMKWVYRHSTPSAMTYAQLHSQPRVDRPIGKARADVRRGRWEGQG